MGKPTRARTTPYKTTPPRTASGPGSPGACHGWPSMVGEYMWKRRWSRTPPPEAGTRVDANTTGQHPSVPLFARKGAYPPGYRRGAFNGRGVPVAAGHHLSSPLPVRRTLGRVLILRGNRREPSSDWAAWISGARLFFSSSLPGRLSLCDRWRGWLAACVAPAPGTGACRPPQSRCGPSLSGLHWLNHARGWPSRLALG